MNLNDELICGYLVTAKQKRINAIYLEMLSEFGRLCEKAGITWWMFFGSLLGAVRHHGFIPWDDDVDLLIPRKDFDRLLTMTNEEFGVKEPYFLQNPVNDPGYVEALLRFRRSDTSFIADWNWDDVKASSGKAPYNLGLNLSLFPMDNIPANGLLLKLQSKSTAVMVHAMYSAFGAPNPSSMRWRISAALGRLLGPIRFYRLYSAPYRWVRRNNSGKVQVFFGHYAESTMYDAEGFSDTVMVPYEDITVPIPAGYDSILRATYGDYMQFPPEDKRQAPHDSYCSPDLPYEEAVRRLMDGSIPLPEGWE